jgi:lipid II:glycine glycyltransferase (peptidoglycan interpeptide bridge formation enzyme)
VTASHQGEVVAGAVVIVAGDVGYYLYGASADAALSLRAGYALHWRIAGWLAERGVCWYDLGDGFGGLRQFKQGFVGKSGVVLTTGEFDRWLNPQSRMVGGAIYGARNLVATLRSWQRWVHKKTATLRARRSS